MTAKKPRPDIPSARSQLVRKTIEDNPGNNRHQIAELMGMTAEQVDWGIRRMIKDGTAISYEPEERGAKVLYYALKDAHLIPAVSVAEECRQNWQGYLIHKVFGGGARLGVENGNLVAL